MKIIEKDLYMELDDICVCNDINEKLGKIVVDTLNNNDLINKRKFYQLVSDDYTLKIYRRNIYKK